MWMEVFIENEAGKATKNVYDALAWFRALAVSRPYPFPYGFVVGTTAPNAAAAEYVRDHTD